MNQIITDIVVITSEENYVDIQAPEHTTLVELTAPPTIVVEIGDIGGPMGPSGPPGAVGPPGSGFVLRGTVPTYTALPIDPMTNDAWITEDDGHLYVWNGQMWVDCGPIGLTETAEDLLAKLITVDGPGSMLDADTLDGHDSTYFASVQYVDDANTNQDAQNAAINASQDVAIQVNADNTVVNAQDISDLQDALAALDTELGNETSAASILAKLLTVDGAGSGLDADTLDGHDSSYFATDADLDALTAAVTALDTATDARMDAIEAVNTSQDAAIALRLTDAPNDTNAYGRKAGAWVDVAEEAPNDGLGYSRKNGAWAVSVGGAYTDDAPPGPPLIDGQLWWDSAHGILYVYYQDADGFQWVQTNGGGSGGAVIYTGDLPPSPLIAGQMWWRSDLGQLFVYYDDGNSKQWVPASVSAAPVDPYLFPVADMRLYTKSAGVVALNNKADGTGVDIATFSTTGNITASNNITAGGAVYAASSFVSTTNSAIFAPGVAGAIYLRPNGPASATGQTTINSGGSMAVAAGITCAGLTSSSQIATSSGNIVAASGIYGANGDSGLYPGGAGRVLQFAANWYLDWNSGTGTLAWQMSGIGSGWTLRNDKAFIIIGNGWKPGGGAWADTSDARIKTVIGDYTSGLDQILALEPVRYTFKGNDTNDPPTVEQSADLEAPRNKEAPSVPYWNSSHRAAAVDGTEYVGLIAQAVELVMPEMVKRADGYIDGEAVTDLRNLDTGPLIFALINAVKELAAKVETLEGLLKS
jgi:hypothetical protein